eukprot:TRINITY_DN22559_c0_g1_i1.p1 TRINITY_DN22559_c0_g1~~TRINITY_DN22559_c0_g1_i1.p1  ORF type:complete len:131 (+),score=5.21 TRINITY_DN22559_c0_g1_i1:143-535(+)
MSLFPPEDLELALLTRIGGKKLYYDDFSVFANVFLPKGKAKPLRVLRLSPFGQWALARLLNSITIQQNISWQKSFETNCDKNQKFIGIVQKFCDSFMLRLFLFISMSFLPFIKKRPKCFPLQTKSKSFGL